MIASTTVLRERHRRGCHSQQNSNLHHQESANWPHQLYTQQKISSGVQREEESLSREAIAARIMVHVKNQLGTSAALYLPPEIGSASCRERVQINTATPCAI